ncbi:hypothetical protein CN140_10990 [Sinorhizobium meliloti]|uniref:hypothetical protein n=1 Tax=Rhizobium meliloti TaxID=382 RepID=UPI000FD970E4|nr:hypothetical protein [Sinorhizobium meliloti]RVL84854.1 hypothetical protein CN140_10990 [Sinorhizobium meliloti]
MQPAIPNLLVSLFTWRPRDGVTPGENFLTEAFVHTLRVNAAFRSQWLTQLLGQSVDGSSLVIDTRASHSNTDSGTTIFPDVDIRGEFASGTPFALLLEIKWGAAYVPSQVIKYDRLLASKPNPHLVFLCARGADYRRALNDTGKFKAQFHPLLWESVFASLQSAAADCQFSKELLGFMHHHGLSPGEPISMSMAEGYIASKPILERFHRYAEKLLREFDWSILPATHRDIESAEVRDRYGRVAIEFAPSWNGAVTIGFLYDNKDHGVPFADGTSNSIDLMMRIEAAPKAKGRDPLNAAIRANTTAVRNAGGVVHFDSDGVNRNRHTLFIAQKSLTDFLSSSVEGDQLQAMYGQLKAWSEALFSDGMVGDALAQLARG